LEVFASGITHPTIAAKLPPVFLQYRFFLSQASSFFFWHGRCLLWSVEIKVDIIYARPSALGIVII